MININDTTDDFIGKYYENYILTKSSNLGYYPSDYEKYFDKYDNDILETHCPTIVDHHLDVSKYMLDIHDCTQALNYRTKKEKDKSFIRRAASKLKVGLFTFLLSELFINLYCLVFLLFYPIRAYIVNNNFSFITVFSTFMAFFFAYKIMSMFIDIKIKKKKTFSDFSLYKPKDKIKYLSEVLEIIYDKLFDYLKTNNTIPERKLLEVMRKHPCMYNDETFLGLYLMAKQSISLFDSAESVFDAEGLDIENI